MKFNDVAENAVEISFIRSIELAVDEIRCLKTKRKLLKQGSYQVFCKTQINRHCPFLYIGRPEARRIVLEKSV